MHPAGLNTNSPTSENQPHGRAPADNTGQAQPQHGSSASRPGPLMQADEMMDALQEIPVPPSGYKTRGGRTDPSITLRNMVANSHRQAAAAARAAASSDAKRPRSESSPTADPKRLKMIPSPKRPGPRNFQDVWVFNHPAKCIIRTGHDLELVMGSTVSTRLGYGVRTMIDGGKYGEPSITINIGINTNGQKWKPTNLTGSAL